MKTIGFIAALFVGLCLLSVPETAHAQATRTWVSGVGDDANPCSRTAPCKTFAGAISKTATAGEINCIDPGGFGALTITKSIAIICDNVEAGVLVSGTNGITVNTPPGSIVYLSGLDIEGLGTSTSGIAFLGSGSLHINHSTIRGFNVAPAAGINFIPNAASTLTVTNTIIRDNGTGTTGGGIIIAPPSGGGAMATLSNDTLANNVYGLFVNSSTASSVTSASITDVVATGNSVNGFTSYAAGGTAAATLTITRSMSVNNATGIVANGGNATLRIGESVVSGNATGVKIAGGGIMRSFGDNQIIDNTTPGPAIPTIPPS